MSENNQPIPISETEVQHKEGIVLYTDGGCVPNPGCGGWGVHGYHYTTEPSQRGTGLASQVLTEKGYVPMSQAKKVVGVTPLHYFDFFGVSGNQVSNNAAEVDALFFALERLKQYDKVKSIQVFTDSEYLRRGLTEWVRTWKARNWCREDGTPVPNAVHWQRLLAEVEALKLKSVDLVIDWVKGHNDDFGNTMADKLASIAVSYQVHGSSMSDFTVSPAQGYWKSDVVKHPFLNYRRMYFNSVAELNIVGHYYQADTETDDDYILGKKTPETCYSVVRLKEPDNVIEKIKSHQFMVSNMVNAVMRMRLDKVFSPDVYPFVENHGRHTMRQTAKSTMGIDFVDRKPITIELNPAGLSLRSIESFSFLEDLLDKFIRCRDGQMTELDKRSTCRLHDVTDKFFEKVEKTKKKEVTITSLLRPEFGVGFKDLMVDVVVDFNGVTTNVKIPLILGADVLPRNSLKRIETMNPKIHLITWMESEHTLRYACVVEVDSGIGIWANFFANRVFLK